jgi:hypothetical protein
MALVYGRKKKDSNWAILLVILHFAFLRFNFAAAPHPRGFVRTQPTKELRLDVKDNRCYLGNKKRSPETTTFVWSYEFILGTHRRTPAIEQG